MMIIQSAHMIWFKTGRKKSIQAEGAFSKMTAPLHVVHAGSGDSGTGGILLKVPSSLTLRSSHVFPSAASFCRFSSKTPSKCSCLDVMCSWLCFQAPPRHRSENSINQVDYEATPSDHGSPMVLLIRWRLRKVAVDILAKQKRRNSKSEEKSRKRRTSESEKFEPSDNKM